MLNLIKMFGYFGIFIVSLISTSTLFLPAPLYSIITFSSFLGMNPILVALVSGIGMTIGEFSGYLVGVGSGAIIYERNKKIVIKFKKFFKKFGLITVSIFAFLPFPFDFVGIMAGIGRYDIKKFFLATFIGKFLKALLLVYIGVFLGEILVWYS